MLAKLPKHLVAALVAGAALLSSSAFAREDEVCAVGFEAFKTNLYPVIMNGPCVTCHQSGPGPIYAHQVPEQAYLAVKNYVNFSDIANSRISIRAGNAHDRCTQCNLAMRTRVVNGITAWFDQGEKDCDQSMRFRTAQQAVPANLPTNSFVKMRFDLRDVDAALAGANIEIEIKRLAEPAGDNPGAYLIRKPRISSSRRLTIETRNMRILNNNKYQEEANAYTRVNAVTSPNDTAVAAPYVYPVLSPEPMILIQDGMADKLSVTFEMVQVAQPVACKAQQLFHDNVMPVVEARGCKSCHGQANNPNPIGQRAFAAFKMDVTDETLLCRRFRERAWGDGDILPAIVQYPLNGRFEHPVIIPSRDEVLPTWIDWINAEFGTFNTFD